MTSTSPSLLLLSLLAVSAPLAAQTRVLQRILIDDEVDPFHRTLGHDDRFGTAIASLGDLNGDGSTELAVGAAGDFRDSGAVWIFSLAPDRNISRFVKVGPREGMPEPVPFLARFGSAIAALGDVDGDGVGDLAVGAPGDSDGLEPPFTGAGAVWILFMNRNGSVRELVKFSRTRGGFGGQLLSGDQFGAALATLGDLDGNGVPDLVVGAPGDDAGGQSKGALWIVLLESDGSVRGSRKVATGAGGLPDVLGSQEGFGATLACLGDLDGDGRSDLAVGSVRQGGASTERLRILFLDASHGVRAMSEITPGYGRALAAAGDRNGDTVPDLVADGVTLFLQPNGSLLASVGSASSAASVAVPGDLNGDGNVEAILGFPLVDGRDRDVGSIQIAEFLPDGAIGPASFTGNSLNLPLPFAPRSNGMDRYGYSIEPLGDLDDDGEPEIAVGAPRDQDGRYPQDAGAVWLHSIDGPSGARATKLSRSRGALPLNGGDLFGSSLASPGDLDGNGTHELVVGAPGDDDARRDGGALYVLFLNTNGSLSRFTKIREGAAGFFPAGALSQVGLRLEALDDLDGDGRREIVVSATGAVFVLFLDATGAVKKSTQLDASRGTDLSSFGDLPTYLEHSSGDSKRRLATRGTLPDGSRAIHYLELDDDGQIASSTPRPDSLLLNGIAAAGDLDGNGICDLASLGDGRLTVTFHSATYGLAARQDLGAPRASALASLGDLSGDGLPDLALGDFFMPGQSRVVLFSMDGIATVGFEERDSIDAEDLENGRQVPRPHPGRTFVISSGGANLGAAIFDSTPGGPNAGGQDPDLLVGSGNVLVLQDSLSGTQTVPGLFDHPNDDRDGGWLALDLPRPVRACSLELVDQDTDLGQSTTVTLFDENGRSRTYYVPPGFTEDVHQTGTGGWRTLRLDTLDPQPGYLATATASQQPGFLDARVRRIEVQLSGSGAIDDFLYDPWP